jgi:hypothetical protein
MLPHLTPVSVITVLINFLGRVNAVPSVAVNLRGLNYVHNASNHHPIIGVVSARLITLAIPLTD